MDCKSGKTEAFPFTDDVFSKKSDAGIKSHLEDLAKKHPEFAGDLKCPPWGGTHTVDKSWENARTIPVLVEKNETTATNSHSQPANEQRPNESSESMTCQQSLKSHPKENLNHRDLKNTIHFAEQVNKSNQNANNEPERSLSVPSETPLIEEMNKQEPKRFMSKVEITPINPYEQPLPAVNDQQRDNEDKGNQTCVRQIPVVSTSVPMADPGSPQVGRHMNDGGPPRDIPVVTEQAQQQQNRGYKSPQSSHKQPQVRHIPIFVEGRSDPVVTSSMPVEFDQRQDQSDLAATPLKRKLDNGNITSMQSMNGPVTPNQAQGSPHPQNQPEQEGNPTEVSFPHTSDKPVTLTPSKFVDPMERIQRVQEEVNALTAQIEQFNGTLRSDKEYLYIDEMLTRNLIKLDTIEVEGNEKLRSARKDVIISIQKSIAMLEKKVPSLNTGEQLTTTIKEDETKLLKAEGTVVSDVMEIDNTSTQVKTPEKLDCKDNKTEKKK